MRGEQAESGPSSPASIVRAQGLSWKAVGGDEWIGRLLSLRFAVILVVAVWLLARRLATD